MTEKELSVIMKKYWKVTGWYVIRNQLNIGSKKGLSDYTILKNGIVLFVELKGERGKLSPDQIEFGNDIKEHGGNYICIYSLDEFLAFINNYIKENNNEVSSQ